MLPVRALGVGDLSDYSEATSEKQHMRLNPRLYRAEWHSSSNWSATMLSFQVALELSQLQQLTGRQSPTVIT